MKNLNVDLSTRYEHNISSNLINFIKRLFKIFLETRKTLELKSATWSDYEHHNTVTITEFLVCIVPSSEITLSKTYTMWIIAKIIILQTYFLDVLSNRSNIMAEKWVDLFYDTVNCIAASLPSIKEWTIYSWNEGVVNVQIWWHSSFTEEVANWNIQNWCAFFVKQVIL